MAKTKQQIIILGEEPLVEEMTLVCHQHKYSCLISKDKLPRSATAAFELTNTDGTRKKKNLEKLEKSLSPATFIFSSSITISAAEQATWLQHPERLIGISALPGLLSSPLIEIALPQQVKSTTVQKALSFLQSLGKEISVIQDRIGMVTPRVLCMLINEAYFTAMENVGSPKDIDLAMKLGTNYPLGPIEWASKITFKQVISVLDALHANLGEERYRVSPLLRQMALKFD